MGMTSERRNFKVIEGESESGGWATLNIGWTCFPNQDPYFSMCCDYNGGGGIANADQIEKYFGGKHANLLKWHLVGTSQPMHYIANSMYHIEEGKLDYFKSCCVFGALEDDEDELGQLTSDDPDMDLECTRENVRNWLERRLPALIECLHAETAAAGFPAPKAA